MERYILGITGASGSILAKKIIEFMSELDIELNIVASNTAEEVFAYETDVDFLNFLKDISNNKAKVVVHSNDDMFSSIASGSNNYKAMIVVPCSMATIGKFAHCTGDNLLCRAFDVSLKEKRDIVIVPRETPLTSIHLRNLLTLTDLGVKMLPPVPMFYDKSTTYDGIVNGIVGRILKTAGLENDLYNKWNKNASK